MLGQLSRKLPVQSLTVGSAEQLSRDHSPCGKTETCNSHSMQNHGREKSYLYPVPTTEICQWPGAWEKQLRVVRM